MSPSRSGRKRGSNGRSPNFRARKKQKRLDAIRDKSPIPLFTPSDNEEDDDSSRLRRSSRARRVPEVLDSSPVPSNRKKKPMPSESPKNKENHSKKRKIKKKSLSKSLSFKQEEKDEEDEEEAGWRSRLRSRAKDGNPKNQALVVNYTDSRVSRKGKLSKRKRALRVAEEEIEKKDSILMSKNEVEKASDKEEVKVASNSKEKSRRKRVSEAAEEKVKKEPVLISASEDDGDDAVEKVSGEVEEKADSGSDSQDADEGVGASDLKEFEASPETAEAIEEDGEECTNTVHDEEFRKVLPKVSEANAKADESVKHNAAEIEKTVTMKEKDTAMPTLDNTITNLRVKEGRRCGLCGGGTDGKPPKKLVRESMDSDHETYEGSSASEEPNYDIWDGFGDEPGWLGRLLGPILDRFGIARVWVHQHCAIWSPEVYFAGLGCLKNVRAALYRGKLLKCSRCGRPGATIGCRVDRCMKTYHLPCSRAEGCIFDHRKFLIACHDHRHLFQPQGVSYSHQIRKRKARKLKLELRKHSNDAWRKDLEAEEKWLEHCGEDEEFLKREGKRLHRDILRIAPTYIGGSSDDKKMYEGWESVAGLKDVIQCMKEVVILPLLYPDFFNNLGLTPPGGVLLHGYPGTGKTLVVRALIGACSRGDKRIAYFARKGADCLGKYVGDAERQLRLLFQVAEKSQPSIIFFDEIDGLAPCRSRNQDQTHSSVVSTLLSLLDGLKSRGSVIVIGATNRPDSVDPALRRPGRFDREIYFPLPSEKDRSAILSLHTRSWPNPLSGTLLSWIANQTVGYAGADLQALCTHAAMNALKRNFPLKELLSSAEKGAVHGKLPSLPSLIVEERDWLEALVLAQPPCSRREAGMAANDVVSSPLSSYLTTCLLKPLSLLLISFYNEERIWLPPVLYKASKSIRNIIVSFLEKRRLPATSWQSHVHHLLEDKHILKEIEARLSHCGLVSGPSVSGSSFLSDNDNDYLEKFGPLKFSLSGASTCDSRRRLPLNSGNSSGFRVLISGSPRSGQKHLACCILHGFMGHVEIQKVNLATISQKGHGDLFRGLTQIISKCLNLGRCVIYMPRIDLWATNENPTEEVEENQTAIMTTKSSSTASNGERSVSELWNSFVEEVESACRSASLIIVATCELHAHDLPLGIKQFFSSDVLNAASAPSVHTIPRFFLHTDGTFDLQLVIHSSATKLSHDLVQSYVQQVYQRTHPSRSQKKMEVPNTFVVNSEAQRQNVENREEPRLMDAAQITFKQNQQGENSNISRLVSGQQEVGIRPSNNQELFPKILSSKAIKGSSALPIATFGFQILRYPQFAELCWVTSKLREGPSTDINGPWKGWPFNSCVMHGSSSPDKAQAGGNSSIQKEGANSGVVRGLIAVGLLSYRGVYTSVLEVAIEIRKVLELLVGQVRAKILARKDRYQYLRILSQAAYIEDMVNSWAYTYQSLYMNNSATESSSKLVSAGRMTTENNLTGSVLMDIQSRVPNLHSKTCDESVPSGSSAKSIDTDGQCFSLSKGLSDHSLLKSSIPCGEFSRTEHPSLAKKMNNVDHLNDPKLAESCTTSGGPNQAEDIGVTCNGLDTVISPRDAGLSSEEPSKVADHSCKEELSCLYNCCSGCLNKLYALAREILSDRCKSCGHCSTVDDINNIVSSCSLNILAALRKCDNPNVHSSRTRSENCACQHIGKKKLGRPSNQSRSSEKMDFFAGECRCHLRTDESEDTRFDQGLTFFFRKGVLVSSEPLKDVLHCRYENFCLCSMVEKILIMKKPLEYV